MPRFEGFNGVTAQLSCMLMLEFCVTKGKVKVKNKKLAFVCGCGSEAG